MARGEQVPWHFKAGDGLTRLIQATGRVLFCEVLAQLFGTRRNELAHVHHCWEIRRPRLASHPPGTAHPPSRALPYLPAFTQTSPTAPPKGPGSMLRSG